MIKTVRNRVQKLHIKTKFKDESMHIKDEITDTNQNVPEDAEEIKSLSPTVN